MGGTPKSIVFLMEIPSINDLEVPWYPHYSKPPFVLLKFKPFKFKPHLSFRTTPHVWLLKPSQTAMFFWMLLIENPYMVYLCICAMVTCPYLWHNENPFSMGSVGL